MVKPLYHFWNSINSLHGSGLFYYPNKSLEHIEIMDSDGNSSTNHSYMYEFNEYAYPSKLISTRISGGAPLNSVEYNYRYERY